MLALAAVLGAALLTAAPQKEKKGSDQTRSVQGVVTGADEKPIAGAVVQLKNSKTLQIRSFLSKDDGSYYFHGLSPDIDYELSARTENASSATRTLSSFDSRKEAIVNLKLNPKK